MNDKIRIQGARENNLKNVDLTIPRDKLVVFTGLSGSGKSSLAFVIGLTVKTLDFGLVDLTAQAVCQNVDGPEAGVVAGFFVFAAGIAQAHDQPSFIHIYSTNRFVSILAQFLPHTL